MWRCLRDPMFRRFDTILACDGQTHTDTQIHDDSIYRVSIGLTLLGKNREVPVIARTQNLPVTVTVLVRPATCTYCISGISTKLAVWQAVLVRSNNQNILTRESLLLPGSFLLEVTESLT